MSAILDCLRMPSLSDPQSTRAMPTLAAAFRLLRYQRLPPTPVAVRAAYAQTQKICMHNLVDTVVYAAEMAALHPNAPDRLVVPWNAVVARHGRPVPSFYAADMRTSVEQRFSKSGWRITWDDSDKTQPCLAVWAP